MNDSDRKRAALFDDDPSDTEQISGLGSKLKNFAPKKARGLDRKVAKTISEESGFTTSHAPKQNAPVKRDGRRLRKSTRTTQFNVRLKPETADRFWAGAENEGYEYADDFLAHLLRLYEGGIDER